MFRRRHKGPLGLIAAVLLLCSSGCSWPENRLSAKLDAGIKAGKSEIDFSKLTDFRWDRLFVFSPYYPGDSMCKAIALTKADCRYANFPDPVDEGHYFLVFMDGGRISWKGPVHRRVANFEAQCLEKAIPREGARFHVTRPEGYLYLQC